MRILSLSYGYEISLNLGNQHLITVGHESDQGAYSQALTVFTVHGSANLAQNLGYYKGLGENKAESSCLFCLLNDSS